MKIDEIIENIQSIKDILDDEEYFLIYNKIKMIKYDLEQLRPHIKTETDELKIELAELIVKCTRIDGRKITIINFMSEFKNPLLQLIQQIKETDND